MENKGLVSVIIPVYNVEKYLRECIDSVLKQTYENVEVILVDDGSTDTSKKICREYEKKDSRITVVCQENAGASAARNKGLEFASGKYIYFLDSDDWLECTAFEQLFNYINQENAEVVFFNALSIDKDTGKVSDKHYNHKETYITEEGYKVLKKRVLNKEFRVTPWSMFFRKAFLDEHNIRFIEGVMYEDMMFAYQVFSEADKVAHLSESLYYRRYRENSVMTSKVRKKNFDSAVKVYDEIYQYSKNQIEEVKCSEHIARCAYNVINVYEKLNKEERAICKEAFEAAKKKFLYNNTFGDKALRYRCYSKLLWIGYKVVNKLKKVFK